MSKLQTGRPANPLNDRDKLLFARTDSRRHPLDKWPDLTRALLAALYNIDRQDTRPPLTEDVQQQEQLAYKYADSVGKEFVPVDRRTPRQKQLDWLRQRSESVRRMAMLRPMDRIYRIRGGLISAESGLPPFGTVLLYREGPGGVDIGVACIGVSRGPGSVDSPIWATPDGLEDVTDLVRRKLLGGMRSF